MKRPSDSGHEATLAAGELDPTGLVGCTFAERYELLAKLGEGGMGAVFRARDRELDEDIALKVLRTDLADDAAGLVRFRREVKLARRIAHPNVVRTYDLGRQGPLRFLTMELLDGESLAHRASRRMVLPEVLRIAADIARGLTAAHAASVVHRDLKPDNVMLCGDRVVITDFGIARAIEDDASGVTRGVVGTVSYMAPEQVEGALLDGRADVYALGILLFELLTGELPFNGDSPVQVAMGRLLRAAPDPQSIAPTLPDGVAQLVRDALARKREDRPYAQTLLERIEALRGVGMAIAVPGQPPSGTSSIAPDRITSSVTLDFATRVDMELVVATSFEPDADTKDLARDLERALLSEASSQAFLRIVPSGVDPPQGALRFETALRASRGKVRARMRLSRGDETLGSQSIDGALDEPFELEDRYVAAARTLLEGRLGARRGDAGPRRETLEHARQVLERFDPRSLREAIGTLEQVLADTPRDPTAMSLLASAYARLWLQLGASDASVISRAEELALRALDADPSSGEPYHALAMMRLVAGDGRAALRGEQEALRRAPLLAESHYVVGAILCESGFVEEGLRRLDVALRLKPTLVAAHICRIDALELIGEHARADEAVRAGHAAAGLPPMSLAEMRLAVWRRDREYAGRIADRLEGNQTGATWDLAAPFLRAIANSERPIYLDEVMARLTAPTVGGRQRSLMHQIAAEAYASFGENERALGYVLGYASLTGFDLNWVDRCPLLAPLRADPRFAEARAHVAARVAAIFG